MPLIRTPARSLFAALLLAPLAQAQATPTPYVAMVRSVADLARSAEAQQLVARHQMNLLNVLWEDTGRWQGSSVGPNISDVTIEVETVDDRGQRRTALMPVMRHPNFTDKTGDVRLDRIRIPVGNQAAASKDGKTAPLAHVTLREFLAAPERHLSLPGRGRIKGGTLLAPRDSHALVSAQATFLPVPATGSATFWPVIFNYQSYEGNPAVLTLLVTRQGTSVTVVDNTRDTLDGSWGQRLFFNKGGQRAPLTAERLSAVKATGVTANGESADSLGADANLLMIIQVPLKVRARPYQTVGGLGESLAYAPAPAASAEKAASRKGGSDVEMAVLGHGPALGPFTELAGLAIERDPRFPVRVTVQFYQATSNGVLADDDVVSLAAQIDKVYGNADYVGSLVVPSPKDRARPTNWDGVGPMPPGTRCEDFPGLLARGRCTPAHAAIRR